MELHSLQRRTSAAAWPRQQLELVCLGVGMGTSMAFEGICSSAMCLRTQSDHKPILLIDCGNGVTKSCLTKCQGLPSAVFITHNHSDHAGELDTMICGQFERGAVKPILVVCHEDVMARLKEKRVYQSYFGSMIQWFPLQTGKRFALPSGYTGLSSPLEIEVHKGQHSEISYGFVLFYEGLPLLGFTGDSAFSEKLYSAIAKARVILCDGRKEGNKEHAGFSEIAAFKDTLMAEQSVYIYHYGSEPPKASLELGGVFGIQEGAVVPLVLPSNRRDEFNRLTCLYGLILFESPTVLYLVGHDRSMTVFKIMEISRVCAEDDGLRVEEHPNAYSYQECTKQLMADTAKYGLTKLMDLHGILGFVRIPYLHMVVITNRKKVGHLLGHSVYTIKETEIIQVFCKEGTTQRLKSSGGTVADEQRYKSLFLANDLTKDVFFSYAYDLTNPLQINMGGQLTAGSATYKNGFYSDMYTWNLAMTQELVKTDDGQKLSYWLIGAIFGFFKQRTIRSLTVTLIARRSRHNAGPRFLRRGVDNDGFVANEVETEQIVSVNASEAAVLDSHTLPTPQLEKNEDDDHSDDENDLVNDALGEELDEEPGGGGEDSLRSNKPSELLILDEKPEVLTTEQTAKKPPPPPPSLLSSPLSPARPSISPTFPPRSSAIDVSEPSGFISPASPSHSPNFSPPLQSPIPIYLPTDATRRPAPVALSWHNEGEDTEEDFRDVPQRSRAGVFELTLASSDTWREEVKKGGGEEDLFNEEVTGQCRKEMTSDIPISSVVLLRGSIPLHWSQTNISSRQPQINVDKVDAELKEPSTHFRRLAARYNSPLTVLSLIKLNEKRPHESLLGRSLDATMLSLVDKFKENHIDLRYFTYDFINQRKRKHNVKKEIGDMVRQHVDQIGVFAAVPGAPSFKIQRGVMRVNCIDCLDRTNVGQYLCARRALIAQLRSLRVSKAELAKVYPSLKKALQELFRSHGDHIARQYAGSGAMHKDALHDPDGGNDEDEFGENTASSTAVNDGSKTPSKKKASSKGISGGLGLASNALSFVQRYYRNNFTDVEKQQAINILLGNYVPNNITKPNRPNIWELDQHNHFDDAASCLPCPCPVLPLPSTAILLRKPSDFTPTFGEPTGVEKKSKEDETPERPSTTTSLTDPPSLRHRDSLKTRELAMDSRRARDLTEATALKSNNPLALFVLERRKNHNFVVFEAVPLVGASNCLNPKRPLDVYWLKAKRSAKPEDRHDLSRFEKNGWLKYSYEVSSTLAFLYLPFLPNRKFWLGYVNDRFQCRTVISNVDCELLKIYVSSKEYKYRPPKIKRVELVGRVDSDEIKTETISYKGKDQPPLNE